MIAHLLKKGIVESERYKISYRKAFVYFALSIIIYIKFLVFDI